MAQQRKDFDKVAGVGLTVTTLDEFLKGAAPDNFVIATQDIIAITSNTLTGVGYVIWEDNV